MKSIYTLLIFILISQMAISQNLSQHPSESYLGYRLEEMDFSLGAGLPYTGIGRNLMLRELPPERLRKIRQVNVPAYDLVDAFGAAQVFYNTPPFINGNEHTLEVGTDRFGNISTAMRNSWSKPFVEANSYLDFSRDWGRDRNGNDVLDYRPGHRFIWQPGVAYHQNNLEVSGSLRWMDVERWGGEMGHSPDNFGLGESLDASQKQVRLNGDYQFGRGGGHTLKFHGLHTSDKQERRIFTNQWEGKERISNFHLRYEKKLPFSQVSFGLQYLSDDLDENLNGQEINTEDRRLRGMANFHTSINEDFSFKGTARLEKGKNDKWTFLPQAQLDWHLGKENSSSISAYAMTGRRMARPLATNIEWLALFPILEIGEVERFVNSEKIGLAFNSKDDEKRLKWKLAVERTRFRDRVVLERNADGGGLILNNSTDAIFRNSVESMFSWIPIHHNYSHQMKCSALYRFEFFDDENPVPLHAAHVLQFRSLYRWDWLTLHGHYFFRSPQKAENIFPEKTKSYHRVDLSMNLDLSEMCSVRGWMREFEIGVYWDNVLRYFNNKNGVEEAGFINRQLIADAPLWTDATVSNVRLKIRKGF